MNYINRLRGFLVLFVFIIAGLAAHANAQTYFVDITCIYKGNKYFYSQKAVLGKLNTYVGNVKNDAGQAREIIFNSTLTRKKSENNFLLQYQFELADLKSKYAPRLKTKRDNGFFKQSQVKRAHNLSQKPPIQLQFEIMIPVNKKILAGSGKDWKFYVKLRKPGNSEKPKERIGDYQIVSELLYDGISFPNKIVVKPDTQAGYFEQMYADDMFCVLSVVIFPGELSSAGKFNFRYQITFSVDGKRVLSTKGEVELFPGAKKKTIAKGENWKYRVRGLSF